MDVYLQRMRDRSRRSKTELAREIQLTDWSTAGNLSNWSSGVQIPRDICTRLKRYLYSAKCSWIINAPIYVKDRETVFERKMFALKSPRLEKFKILLNSVILKDH